MRQKNNPTPGPDMAGHYEKILKSIAPSLKFLTIDIEFVKQCPKMDLTEVSIKNANPDYNIMQGGISKVKTSYDLDAASRIKSNILNFSNKNNEPYWTPLIEFFAAFFVEEIHASVEMLQTPNNHGPLGVTPGFPFQNHNDAIQPNPFRFSSSITPTNQSVKKFFLKLPGSQWRGPASEHPPGEHLNDILSDLIKIFPCLECINISMTSRFQNHQPNTYDEIGGVDEFLQIYKKCYDTLYFKYKNCKPSINVQILYINDFFHVNRNQIPSSDFEAEINKQLPGFKKEQTSEEDMKIIESFKAPSYMFKPTLNHERTPTVITYQKEANLNEGKISLKGKAFVVYT
uniref:Uncharacterized protein n=1 Tax=Acrobeloides nanus TaxID=290746 RepID=A0A914DTQ2_9BILA